MDGIYNLLSNGSVTWARPDKRQRRRRFWRQVGVVTLVALAVAAAALLAR